MGNRRGTRRVAVLLAAVTLLPALTACSLVGDGQTVIGFLGEDAENSGRMSALVDDVRALGGVTAADGTFDATADQPGPMLTVETSPDATAEQVSAIITRASVDYTGRWNAFNGTVRVTVAPDSVLTVSDFTRDDEDLAAEIDYWRAVEKLVGTPLSLELTPVAGGPEWAGSRLSAVPSDVRATRTLLANYDSLLALEPPPAGAGQLWLPGFTVAGELPPADYVRVYEKIVEVLSVLDQSASEPEGAEFRWSARPGEASVPGGTYSIFAGDVEYSTTGVGSAGWDIVVDAARTVAAAGLERSSFTFQSGEVLQAFHLGECAAELAPGELPNTDSDDLPAALEAAGVRLPAGTAPGYCDYWNAS